MNVVIVAYLSLSVHIHYFVLFTFRYHNAIMIALCLYLFHRAEATANVVVLITVLLLRYSAAGWPGLWPLQPFLDLGATGAPAFNLVVYLGYLGSSTSSLPCPRQLQSLQLHHDRLRRPCPVWPIIRASGRFISFSLTSIPDYLTGEYPGDYGLNISGLAAHTRCLPVLRGYCVCIVEIQPLVGVGCLPSRSL